MGSRRIAILGAGISGICTGIALKRAGIDTFTIFEKSDKLGGTWRDNTYPGAACDVPSSLYSFSFEPKTDWTRKWSPQPEIRDYLEHCAEKYDVLRAHPLRRPRSPARASTRRRRTWHLRTAAGEEIEADVLVSGTGQLNRPHVPDLPGLADFEGTQFHSARWNHDHDLAGEHVAVIGNAASAIQFIPEIAKTAAKVTIFQRSANWIDAAQRPRLHRQGEGELPPLPVPAARAALVRLRPARDALLRVPPRQLAREAHGERLPPSTSRSRSPIPTLREMLTPDYPIGCKRILISDDYYPALCRPNVEVVTSPIERVGRDAVRTRDGRVHRADVLILATGFETTSFLAPMQIEGRGGREARGGVARRRRGLPRPHRRGLPEPLHAVRPEHEPRPQLDHLHDRVPGELRRAAASASSSRATCACLDVSRATCRRATTRDLQRDLAQDRVGRRLQLVQDRVGQGHEQLVRLHGRLLAPHARSRAGATSAARSPAASPLREAAAARGAFASSRVTVLSSSNCRPCSGFMTS